MPDPRDLPRGAKSRRRNPRVRPLRAAALLIVMAACLVSLLLLLPSRGGRGQTERGAAGPSSGKGTRGAPEGAPEGGPEAAAPGSSRATLRPAEMPAEGPAGEGPAGEGPAGAERMPARGEAPGRTPVGAPPQRPERVGRLAVVIDDVGYSLENLEPFLVSRLPLSLSVLPGLPYSGEAARRIQAAGKELLLHLPMEAQNGADPGPIAVLTTMSDDTVRGLLSACLEEIPAVGVNNHMGSSATANQRIMEAVLGYLKSRGLFFLDSRTTGQSVAVQVARDLSEPLLRRDVFLDNDPSAEAISLQLQQGLDLAEQRGQAVLIGHVQNPHIVRVLEEALSELDRRGLQLVQAGDLIASDRE